ncbi:Similar to Wrap53: Telomerase Cajal body protein 1 (Rattus norvegicus) [Cotesia congregata]|uniref:WD repeat-containing protein 79 n=1 Tax=Cotesia congregata TaxID=51543 RepID=A0A8J2E5B2_COTCN|nr:Similar to Wrap53: Telomerase Cajal body protein 1 (Rattus norvegicus) [Cotesia congregata]
MDSELPSEKMVTDQILPSPDVEESKIVDSLDLPTQVNDESEINNSEKTDELAPVEVEGTEPKDSVELKPEETSLTSLEKTDQVPEPLEAEKTEVINFYDWTQIPRLICSVAEEPATELENLTRGCSWSPDGTCLLVPSADFRIRVYELPRELYSGSMPIESLAPLNPAFKVKEGGLVYDTCWYPWMSSWEPETCCFLSTSKETPIHLWDAFTGSLRATYRAYNHGVTQIEFSPCGTKLYSAVRRSNEFICWDLRNPGIILNSFEKRQADTNQRIQFCINNNQIISGGTDGVARIWTLDDSTDTDLCPSWSVKLSDDCINGVSAHKTLPILATCSGQRFLDENKTRDNSVRLWYCGTAAQD